MRLLRFYNIADLLRVPICKDETCPPVKVGIFSGANAADAFHDAASDSYKCISTRIEPGSSVGHSLTEIALPQLYLNTVGIFSKSIVLVLFSVLCVGVWVCMFVTARTLEPFEISS